jgi:hypothetical protein
MASLIVDFSLFFLVLFVLLPTVLIFAMLMRDMIYHKHHRRHAGWHQAAAGKSTW